MKYILSLLFCLSSLSSVIGFENEVETVVKEYEEKDYKLRRKDGEFWEGG